MRSIVLAVVVFFSSSIALAMPNINEPYAIRDPEPLELLEHNDVIRLTGVGEGGSYVPKVLDDPVGEGGSYVPKMVTPNNSGSYAPALAMAEEDSSNDTNSGGGGIVGSISG